MYNDGTIAMSHFITWFFSRWSELWALISASWILSIPWLAFIFISLFSVIFSFLHLKNNG